LLPAGQGNPLAAAFSGVLAAAEVFKSLIAPFSEKVRLFRGAMSLWDLSVGGRDGPMLDESIHLDETAFAACGGIASATFWALGLINLAGSPLLVDPDCIDFEGTNLNRHLTANFGDVGAHKAELAASILREAGCTPRVLNERWPSTTEAFELVVASPDSDAVRRHVQLDLPRTVLNGGTNDGGLYLVSSHDFLTNACLGCVARSDQVDASPLAGAARRLGLETSDLLPYLDSNDPLPAELIERMTVDDEISEALKSVGGKDLLERVCGSVQVGDSGPALSAPMLSAAPGVLLASELAIRSMMPSRRTPGTVTMTSILSGPHARWSRVRLKVPDCSCNDGVYRDFYQRKWPPK